MRKLARLILRFLRSTILALAVCLYLAGIAASGIVTMELTHIFFWATLVVLVVGAVASALVMKLRWPIAGGVAAGTFVVAASVLWGTNTYLTSKKAELDAANQPPPPIHTSAPGPSVPIVKTPKPSLTLGNGAYARVTQHSEGNNSPNSATFGNNSPIIFYPPPKQPSVEEQKAQTLKAERDDVWNHLKAFPTVGQNDDLRETRFSVVNDGGADIANHTLFCHVNSVNYPNDIYVGRSHYNPRRFDKGPLRRGGDGESVECLRIVSLGAPNCADVTIVVDYTLINQPQVRQEKTFRFATTKTRTGNYWDIQPLSARVDYCNSATEP